MTGRATFGELARAASGHLDRRPDRMAAAPAGRGDVVGSAVRVQDFCRSLRRMIGVLDRYVGSAIIVLGGVAGQERGPLTAWPRACLQARQALRAAARALGDPALTARDLDAQPPPDGSSATAVDAATAAMSAGLDLLSMHLPSGQARAMASESDWAPVLATTTVARALLAETAGWARQAARHGTQLTRAIMSASSEMAVQLRGLRTACRSLEAATLAVGTAQLAEPCHADDTELLHAIPASAPEPRRLPDGTETTTTLCQGAEHSAERVRRAARLAVPVAAWSPLLTAESMSRAAAYATVTSHNCEILQYALADRAAEHGHAELCARLTAAAQAAGQARLAWLAANRGWREIKADTDGAVPPVPLAPATVEAGDLALWTGRLAYADPAWTPSLGPSRATRPPGDLAPEPADLARVVAVVHQATITLTTLADTARAQVRAAGRAGRLVVPVDSLPGYYNIQRRFVHAPTMRIERLLAVYRDATTASAQATREAASIAASIRAPSRPLVLARAAIAADGPARLRDATRRAAQRRVGADPADDMPGPIEQQLRHLGVTALTMLSRGRELDQAGERLMLHAAQNPGLCRSATAHRQGDSSATEADSPDAPPRATHAINARRSPGPVLTAGGRDREPEAPEAEP